MEQLKGRKDQIKGLFENVKGLYGIETAMDFLGMLLSHEQKCMGMSQEYSKEIWDEIYKENERSLQGWA